MSKILLVLSNLKHNGDLLEAGSLIEADADQFADLIKAGVVRVVEGAETLEDAAKLVKEHVATAAAKAHAAEAAKPQDTWAPSKPEDKQPETTADTTAPAGETTAPAAGTDAGNSTTAPVVGIGDVPPEQSATAPAGTETGDNL